MAGLGFRHARSGKVPGQAGVRASRNKPSWMIGSSRSPSNAHADGSLHPDRQSNPVEFSRTGLAASAAVLER